MSFPCTSCGACCRRIKVAVEAVGNPPAGELLHFPHTWDESGRCEHLQADHRCAIYSDRPLICRVDDLADLLDPELPREVFIRENIKACNIMMDEDGVSDGFRIRETPGYKTQ